ncbi:glucosyltransferase MdoH [Citrobacter freundii]|nr:glucosyltransferase MdoH [Citrobacter freundii]
MRLMEANPNAGIIQSSPKASGMDTLYAPLSAVCDPCLWAAVYRRTSLLAAGGVALLGHNAIIRVKPFIEHCALAPLPGEGSFAGSILSHDFVEAGVDASCRLGRVDCLRSAGLL